MTSQPKSNKDSIIRLRLTKFSIGFLCSTLGAMEELEPDEMTKMLQRHAGCDWGNCCPHDQRANDEALETGARLFSVYRSRSGAKIWVITEADRSSTTVLLPSEY
jgi:hypothetical protein